MFEAAVRLHSGFKLMFSVEIFCGNSIDDAENMMRRVAGNPWYSSVYFPYHGAFVLTTFGAARWVQPPGGSCAPTSPAARIHPCMSNPLLCP